MVDYAVRTVVQCELCMVTLTYIAQEQVRRISRRIVHSVFGAERCIILHVYPIDGAEERRSGTDQA